MFRHNIYTIPFKGKFIVYQPLNKFAFIGNSAILKLIDDVFNEREVDEKVNKNALSFLSFHDFFNQDHSQSSVNRLTEYNPTVAVLCMTSGCNFKCSYCYAIHGKSKIAEMPADKGKRAIDIVYRNAKGLGEGQFVLSFHGGGEPTLQLDKLKELTAYARGKDLRCIVELTSNGFWEKEKCNWIISNIDNLTLSFDGIKDVQDKQRPHANGNGTFNTVMNNVNRFDKSGLRYGIRLTVTDNSIKRLPESISFLCNNTNCTTFQVEPAFNTGKGVSRNQVIKNNKLFVEYFLKAFDIAFLHNCILYYSGSRLGVNTTCFCTAFEKALVVTPEGLLSSCYEISGSSHPLAGAFHFGRLSSTGELNIDLAKRRFFHTKIEERRKLCRNCFCYWHCAGDCPARTIIPGSFSNRIFTDRCKVNREITKNLLIHYMSRCGGIYKENLH